MANAVAMISRCFAHQHPDEFGRDSVSPVILSENSIRFEAVPEGSNREGGIAVELAFDLEAPTD